MVRVPYHSLAHLVLGKQLIFGLNIFILLVRSWPVANLKSLLLLENLRSIPYKAPSLTVFNDIAL